MEKTKIKTPRNKKPTRLKKTHAPSFKMTTPNAGRTQSNAQRAARLSNLRAARLSKQQLSTQQREIAIKTPVRTTPTLPDQSRVLGKEKNDTSIPVHVNSTVPRAKLFKKDDTYVPVQVYSTTKDTLPKGSHLLQHKMLLSCVLADILNSKRNLPPEKMQATQHDKILWDRLARARCAVDEIERTVLREFDTTDYSEYSGKPTSSDTHTHGIGQYSPTTHSALDARKPESLDSTTDTITYTNSTAADLHKRRAEEKERQRLIDSQLDSERARASGSKIDEGFVFDSFPLQRHGKVQGGEVSRDTKCPSKWRRPFEDSRR